MDLIIIGGIKRSASTAQYNMVRLILKKAAYTVHTFGEPYQLRADELPDGQVDLVKRHPFDRTLAERADHIFVTDRDNKAILKSLERMWGGGDRRRLPKLRANLAKWMLYTTPSHYFYYRKHTFDDRMWMDRLIDVLDVDVSVDDIIDDFRAIGNPDEYDPETMMHPNHISDED